MFDSGQFDPLVIQSGQPEGKAKSINSKLEIRIRRGVVPLLNEIEVIVNLVNVQLGRELVEMQRYLSQMKGIVLQGAFAFS